MIKIEECIKFIENRIKDNQNLEEIEYYEAFKYHLESYQSLNNTVIESIDKLNDMIEEYKYGHIQFEKPSDEEVEIILDALENKRENEIRIIFPYIFLYIYVCNKKYKELYKKMAVS
ncbi:hypothetical protein [Brachyspira hyodysenteriae]|uniref:hypothetical protein n=1 Tax=Brachyspira hyodysenteriae TaxID=159 RepID=UPI0022CD22EA|nr:hypothetical protein [Brachyspira hyodysenteriae]MDA0010764.1 hypothetical protein [Brachyspira hyodysenteriae]